MILYEIPKRTLDEELERHRQILWDAQTAEDKAAAVGAIEVLTWILRRYKGHATDTRTP